MSSDKKSFLHNCRWILVGLMSLLVFVVAGCSSQFRKLPESKVDNEMKSVAQRIATNILEANRAGQFEPLGDEASPAMQKALTPKKQEDAYKNIKGMFGDFKSMEYVETWLPKDGTLLTIYRFKGIYTSGAMPEIRVVMDGEGKLSGLWIKPWRSGIK